MNEDYTSTHIFSLNQEIQRQKARADHEARHAEQLLAQNNTLKRQLERAEQAIKDLQSKTAAFMEVIEVLR